LKGEILMNKPVEKMTYSEFKDWGNERACDGLWSMNEALGYIEIRKRIDAIHIKGLFRKKATNKAQELEWQKIILETTK
jgi:hypothetical protein